MLHENCSIRCCFVGIAVVALVDVDDVDVDVDTDELVNS